MRLFPRVWKHLFQVNFLMTERTSLFLAHNAPSSNTKFVKPRKKCICLFSGKISWPLFCIYRPRQANWDLWRVDMLQCGNLAIFLPLWLYVKSILADFRRSKTGILLTIWESLAFDFWKNSILENVISFHKFKIHSYWNSQNGSFWGSKMTKIWFHIKSG